MVLVYVTMGLVTGGADSVALQPGGQHEGFLQPPGRAAERP